MSDPFFSGDTCQRCGCALAQTSFNGRKMFMMSWFTTERICVGIKSCQEKETEIKSALFDRGEDPFDYEGCGYVPTAKPAVDFIKKA